MTPEKRAVLFGRAAPVGPLDLVSGALVAYSAARKLRAAYTGPLIKLRRASDSVETDIYPGSRNELDPIAASVAAGASGFIKTKYDQTTNANHATQATAGSQPAFGAALVGGKPGATFNASSLGLGTPLSPTNVTAIALCRLASTITKISSAQWLMTRAAATDPRCFWGFGAWTGLFTDEYLSFSGRDTGSNRGGALCGSGSISGSNIVTCTLTGQVTSIFLNGVSQTVTTGIEGPNDTATNWRFINADLIGTSLVGDLMELYVFNSALSAANRQLIESNIGAFYGVPVS